MIKCDYQGGFEYVMPKAAAVDLLAEKKKRGIKGTPQQYLINYVNDECGLLYECKKVTIR